MRKLLAKIRRILKDRRTRQLLTRTISLVAAIVVFVTTYALVLPAITMESEANCGIEAHQHDSSCYEDRLICGEEESPGHHHSDACYEVNKNLVCSQDVHQHGEECYDEEGNLICGLTEHTHDDSCYKETRELVCEIPESDGHQHTDSCYEKVLICGKEVHTHSTACYSPAQNSASAWTTEYAAVAATDNSAAGITVETFLDDAEIMDSDPSASSTYSTSFAADDSDDGFGDPADTAPTSADGADDRTNDGTDDNIDGTENQWSETAETSQTADTADTDTVDTAITDDSASDGSESSTTDPAAGASVASTASTADTASASTTASTASAASATAASTASASSTASTASTSTGAAAEDSYVPTLDPVDFTQILTDDTGIYYYHAADGDTVPETSGDITDWKPVENDTILDPADIIRVYLAYSIPAGTLNDTNPVARYRLPSNIHLSDKQVESINSTVNGIANQYVSMDTLEITDPEKYNQFLGVEAIEGTRSPSDDIEKYFKEHKELDGQEYISAVVRVEDVYDDEDEDKDREESTWAGTDLVFTFTPYSIQKNQHTYDKDGMPTSAGQTIQGWLTFDLRTNQIDFETVDTETMATDEPENTDDDQKTDSSIDETANNENASTSDAATADKDRNNNIDTEEEEKTIRTTKEAEIVFVPETKDPQAGLDINEISETLRMLEIETETGTSTTADGKAEKSEKETESEETENGKKAEEPSLYCPAQTFQDSITASMGTLSTDTENGESASIPEQTELTVYVEADEGTFPEGTSMKLSAVEDMDAVASAVEGAVTSDDSVSNKTRGFHAVDISFWNKEGKEIEPLKPIRVSMKSESIKQAVEDSSTAPVVVHIEEPKTENEDLYSPDADSNEDSVNDTIPDENKEENNKKNGASDNSDNEHEQSTDLTEPIVTIVETEENTTSGTKEDVSTDTLTFEAGTFSVYAIVYTVDFHYTVNGREYNFSIPGGGFVTLQQLVEVLGMANGDAYTENALTVEENSGDTSSDADGYDSGEDSGINNTSTYLDVEISDKTREFVADVADVMFSDSSLVWVGKVDESSTVGGMKEAYRLECQYSADLTGEQIEEINAQTVESGDWALISMRAFDTEESLTVTMKNGDVWSIRVTDDNVAIGSVNSNEGYVIYTEYGGKYYALKDDGTTGEFTSLSQLDDLGNEYRWKFTRSYTESTWYQADNGYTYYFIRSVNDAAVCVNLNNDGSMVVQREAADVFIINHPNTNNAYAFGGSKSRNHDFGWFNADYNLPIPLQMNTAGVFTSDTVKDYWGVVPDHQYWYPPTPNNDTPTYAPIYIYQQPGSAYEFTVQTNNIEHGYVKGTDKDGQPIDNSGLFITKTASNGLETKTNLYLITAVPQNDRIKFSHWSLDDEPITVNGMTEERVTNASGKEVTAVTIPADKLLISDNGAVLEAHFTRNENYVPTEEEQQGRNPIYDKSSFDEWLTDRIGEQKPLDGVNKTAEVYDYENRIYRVDLTANSDLTILDGDIDLGFVIDVSSSMRFPAKLKNTNDISNPNIPRDLSTINYYSGGRTNGEGWGLKTNKTYYVITDPESTATICKLWYDSGTWKMQDSSKTDDSNIFNPAENPSSLKYWYDKPKTLLIKEADDFVHKTGSNKDTGTITTTTSYQEAADGSPKTRAMYLEASIKDAIAEMYSIKQKLSVASNSNSSVATTQDYAPKIAYSTFCEWVNPLQYNFIAAPQNGINITYTYKGGTSTDMALVDAAGYTRSDVNDNVYMTSNNNAANWNRLSTDNPSYTNDKNNRGFHWDSESDRRYVVLITDGAPQRKSLDIDEKFLNKGRDLLHEPDNKATLISVGLSMGDVRIGAQKLYNISDEDSNYVPYYYKAEDGSKLTNALYDIIATTVSDAIVTGNVTDTIGQAFYPVDKLTGNPLNNGDRINLQGEKVNNNYSGKYGTINYNTTTKTYTVTWSDQDIKKPAKEGETGWHGTVYVKAKEDLFGGNAIPTNDGEASITTVGFKNKETATTHELKSDYRISRTMETPKVNVNELSVTQNDADWTVYVGTEVDPYSQLQKLFDEINVLQVIKDGVDPTTKGIETRVNTDANTNRVNTNMSYDFPSNVDEERSDSRAAINDRQTFKLKTLIAQLYADAPANAEWKQNFNADGTPMWDKLIQDYEVHGADEQRVGIQIPYNSYGIPGNNYISLILDISHKGTEPYITSTNTNPHNTTEIGDEVEKYSLTVKYDPDYRILPKGQKGEADIVTFHVGGFESQYQGNGAGREEKKITHIINTYAKPFDILKLYDENDPTTVVPGTVFKLYRAAKQGETQIPASELSELGLSGNLVCIDTQTTGNDGIAHIAAVADGKIASELLNAHDSPYYLVEYSAPSGYIKDTTVRMITVDTNYNTYTNITNGLVEATRPTVAYNWIQGVQFAISNGRVIIANPTTHQEVTLPGNRVYAMEDDRIVFQTTVLNEKITGKDVILKKVGINNTDPNKTQTDLPGAKFTLYYATGVNNDTKGDIVVIGEAPDTQQLENLESGVNGVFWSGKLEEGVYLLEETVTPAGYNSLGYIIRLTVTADDVTLSPVGTVGNLEIIEQPTKTETNDTEVWTIKAINIAGVELPATGGPGTNQIYLLGTMITALAGAGLVMRKKRREAA